MRCATWGCENEVGPWGGYCGTCQQVLRQSDTPLVQGRVDVQRSWKSRRVPPRRPPRDENRRARSLSPEPVRQKRRSEESEEKEESSSKKLRTPSLESELSWGDRGRSGTTLSILFVPFEGNFNKRMMSGLEKKGGQSSSLFEGQDIDPFFQFGKKTLDEGTLFDTVGTLKFWSKGGGDRAPMPLLSTGKDDLFEMLDDLDLSPQAFYEEVVQDRLHSLRLGERATPVQGLPEIVILSERLLAWPERLVVLGHTYHRAFILGGGSNLQDMAAYTLATSLCGYTFSLMTHDVTFKRKEAEESWLIVEKTEGRGCVRIACVHLTSNFTSSTQGHLVPILEEVHEFARSKKLQAILGDCNINTFGHRGGVFPESGEFVLRDDKMALKTTFGTSNGAGNKLYMGGLICDLNLSFLPTLTTLGSASIPPHCSTGRFSGKTFSDHPSVYANYIFFHGRTELKRSVPDRGLGGDCFFVALSNRLGVGEDPVALRGRIIAGIRRDVQRSPNLAGSRVILVQQPLLGGAVPVRVADARRWMDEMARSGRWMEDSLIPYVANFLVQPIVVQYDDGYAVFAVNGTRTDYEGVIPLRQPGLRMNCRGNHFW